MTFVTKLTVVMDTKVDAKERIKELNAIFRPLQPEQRITELYRHFTKEQVAGTRAQRQSVGCIFSLRAFLGARF